MFESQSRLRHAMDEAVREIAKSHAKLLRAIGEFDEQELWQSDGTSMSQWLSYQYQLTSATAREWVRAARALRALPSIARAYGDGRLSWDQLRPLTRFATPESDECLAAEAPRRSAASLWDDARQHERVHERDVEDTYRRRYLDLEWDEDRTELFLQGRVGAEQGAVLEMAVAKRAEELVIADDPWDVRGARRVDALLELVAESNGKEPAPVLVVHVETAVLTGELRQGDGVLSESEDGTRMSRQTVRRLACDARIEWMLERGGGVVGIGRQGRSPTGAMQRALRFRDRSCVFPGCGRIRWLKAHHIVHWAHGGRTDLDNLVRLCHAHHRAVHEGGWSIRGRPGSDLRFLDPRGRPLVSLGERLAQPAVVRAPALVSTAG